MVKTVGAVRPSVGLQELADQIIGEIEDGQLEDKKEIEKRKRELCREMSFDGMPKNSDILQFASETDERAQKLLKTTPTRTLSGVANIAVMTKPAPCGGRCIYCPKGKDAPQSYTGKEPAARRAIRNEYDPFDQVQDRLSQYEKNGHPVDKSKLIIMGGTFPFMDEDYQREFVREAFNGFNDYGGDGTADSLQEAKKINEQASVRNVGVTIETRPDVAEEADVDRILELGGTRIEMGVQTTFDSTHEVTRRGHGVEAVKEATKRLKDAGFKVAYHIMLGMPSETREDDIEKFRKLFNEAEYQPDEVKIYPCEVVPGTKLHEMYENGEFEPITEEEAKDRLKEVKKRFIPPYVRIKRVMRDIPSTEVEAGPALTNMRQMALNELQDEGERCSCIRCREVGHVKRRYGEQPEEDNIELVERSYKASGGTEYFISFEDTEKDIILGYVRLRDTDQSHRPELGASTGIVRQLKVLGSATGLGEEGSVQHQGYGSRLLERAEEKASELGKSRLAVISGVGVREYYRKKGYRLEGPYMVKDLD